MIHRWRVHCGKGSNRGNFYAFSPAAKPSGWTRFTSYAEAISYATERASTVEVTLPRDPLVWESGWDSDGRIYVEETNGNEICYEPGKLGEIARHLLAYHYQKEAQ